MLRLNVSGNRRGRGVSPVGGRALRHGHLPSRRASRSLQQSSSTHLAANWRSDFRGSEYSSAQSTHRASVSSFADETTHYTSADTLFDQTFGFTPPPPASVSDAGSFLQTYDPSDNQEPLQGQGAADVATVEAFSLRSIGGHFPESPFLDVTPEAVPGQALPPVLHGAPGFEELLFEDVLEQLEPSEPLEFCEQPGPFDQAILPEQLVPSQYRHSSNPNEILPQDALREPPWNHQQSNYSLRPPLPDFTTGALPQESLGSAATHSRAPTALSSQGSQAESSLPSIRCDECGGGFGTLKSLHRHQATVHQDEEDGVFICKCGTTANRKDNFKGRHFRKCPNKHRHTALDVYTCICDYKDGSSISMEQHWKSCPRQNRPGRPSRSA